MNYPFRYVTTQPYMEDVTAQTSFFSRILVPKHVGSARILALQPPQLNLQLLLRLRHPALQPHQLDLQLLLRLRHLAAEISAALEAMIAHGGCLILATRT